MGRSVTILAVQRIEEYGDVLKVILKPTKKFPVGYFYTDNNEITRELIKKHSWSLSRYVETYLYGSIGTNFHREYAKKVLGYYPDCIDHINGIELDNRNINLSVVSYQQNIRNKPSIGYNFISSTEYFQVSYSLNNRRHYYKSFKTEPEALQAIFNLQQEVYSDYNYNFYLDRRNDLDILNAELIGKLTSQQAIYYHVKRYIESNPWYVYRYNLLDYCNKNYIFIPSFSLDSQGFMINPVTKERLCPY